MSNVERYHWINTIVGILDSAFHLTDVEELFTIDYVRRVLEALQIPERGTPERLPAPLALEISAGYYTNLLHTSRDSGVEVAPRAIVPGDMVVSVEAWRQAIMTMLTTSYPDLGPHERLVAAQVFNELLVALGLPDRAASFFPDDVVRAHHDMPDFLRG